MGHLRITGIVRMADRVRRALGSSLTSAQHENLARQLNESLRQIEAILRDRGAHAGDLPSPSRRAYEFLKGVDLSAVQIAAPAEGDEEASECLAGSVRFPGLRGFLDRVLDDIASQIHKGTLKPEANLAVITRAAKRLDNAMQRDNLQPGQIETPTRVLIGWFRYFSDRQRFDAYVMSVRRCQAIMHSLPAKPPRWKLPVLVHFRPVAAMYRWRAFTDATRLTLPTPMLTFDEPTFATIGRLMLGDSIAKQYVTKAMLSDAYQELAAELDAASGEVEHTAGMHHDLLDVFERINRAYFAGQLPRPKLTWSRALTHRKFGHYDFVRDSVMISATLDRPDLPPCVIEHVMHHELLHKKHGIRFNGSQQRAHTAQFKAEERIFRHYDQATHILNHLGAHDVSGRPPSP